VAIRQRLLETPAERVSPDLAKTVSDFCEPIDVIGSAYVGLIEITKGFDPPEQDWRGHLDTIVASVSRHGGVACIENCSRDAMRRRDITHPSA